MTKVGTVGDYPVIYFGAREDPTEQSGPGAFKLSRSVLKTNFGSRPAFTIDKADPVTTRVMQINMRSEEKIKWLIEFAEKKPLDPLLCWLVVMRAVDVRDVLNAIGEYGWSAVGLRDSSGSIARIRFDDVAGDIAEFRRRVEWSLIECESEYGYEWLDKLDASILLSACEATLEVEQEDRTS